MQIKCTSCGATNQNIQGQNCNYCGNTLTDDIVILNRIQALNLNGNLYKLAEVAFEGGNFDEALKYYNKCLEIDTDFFEAWYKKGLSILNLNSTAQDNFKSEQVISNLNQATNNSPNAENFKKRIKKDVIPFICNYYKVIFQDLKKSPIYLIEAIKNTNNITEYIIDNIELDDKEKEIIRLAIEETKAKMATHILIKLKSITEIDEFDIIVSKIKALLKKTTNNRIIETQDSESILEKKVDNSFFRKANNWAITNPKIFWPIALITLFFWGKIIVYLLEPNPTWCDCDKAAGDAIEYSAFRGKNGSTAKYDEKTIRACAKKVLKLNKTLNIEPDELSIEYISQFSYEICKNGYYEGKGSDNRGEKYYPKAD